MRCVAQIALLMKFLFVHQNFPGQYLHLARHLAADRSNEVVFITQREDAKLAGVRNVVYKPTRPVTGGVHHYVQETEGAILNAQAVVRAALQLKEAGFIPDVMLGHNGWGEIWYLKEVFPHAPLLGYFEFFYRLNGADVGFDPADPPSFDTGPRLRTKNLGNLLALDAVDWGQCPTRWQHSLYPRHYQSILSVLHEGIDTQVAAPDKDAFLSLPTAGIELRAGDEVVTYVARNLEPYRGFRTFMRSLPAILDRRPKAQVVVVGGNEVSYGAALLNGRTFKQEMLDEVGPSLDLSRIHFLGKIPYSTYMKVLQVSRAHVYLTYPFVLSWSMLEAMSANCLIVGSRTPPVEEVVRHGQNGLLVDFFAPGEVSDRVIEALEDRNAHTTLRQNARRTVVEQFDLATVCLPAQLTLLNKLVARRAGLACFA